MIKTCNIWVVAAIAGLALQAQGAILLTDTFDSDDENWGDRDAGEMTVTYTGGFGNPAGSMQGTFAAQGSPLAETDAFRLTSGLGDLTQGGTYDLTAFAFDFYALNVLPSDLIFRFGDGVSTFFRGVTLNAVESWQTFSLSLASVSGWFGGDQTAFDNALSSVTFVEIQLSRSGIGSQTYYLDNFELTGELAGGGGGGGGPSAIPEPNTISLLLLVVAMLLALRRYRGFSTLPA
jgi:hypothetical protein